MSDAGIRAVDDEVDAQAGAESEGSAGAAASAAGGAAGAAGAANRSSRWSAMLDVLARDGRLSVTDAAVLLGVSEATIRRDFAELAKRQLVARNHGGVVATSVAYELPARYREASRSADLDRIGAMAARLIQPGQVVGINGGTTTTATARAITARTDLVSAEHPKLRLVTNALNIASEAVLRPHVQCVSLGGVARPESYEVSGPLAEIVLTQIWLDVAIIGLTGLTSAHGATCHFEDEASTVRAMIDRSQTLIVVTSGAKVGTTSFAAICPATEIDHLVTTEDAPASELARLREAGVQVHLA